MKEIPLTSRQMMLSPDQLAYEMNMILTPKEIENTKIATYVLIGVLATITIGLLCYSVYEIHQEKKVKN